MNCPKCEGDTKVLDTRFHWRRRECIKCNHRFNTIESITTQGFKTIVSKKVSEPVIVAKEPIVINTVKVKTPRPKKEPVVTVSAVKRNADARRKIEELRDLRDDFDYLDPDFDFLPERW